MKLVLFLILSLFTITSVSANDASDVSLKFKFTKKPPEVVVVYFADAPGKIDSKLPNIVDQKNKKFIHKIVFKNQEEFLLLKNSDNMDHNIYSRNKKVNVNFDVGLLPPNSQRKHKVNWVKGEFIKIGCKIHPKMRSWVANVESQHVLAHSFDRKKREFTIKMEKIPNSAKNIVVWMPGYDRAKITIPANQDERVKMTRKNGKLDRGMIEVSRK